MLNNVNKSVVDAVQKILESDTSVKISTSTGTKVLGHRYGNAAKTHRELSSDPFAVVRGPKEKDIKDIESEKKTVKEDGDCVTKPEAKDIAKKEVKGHEKKMHKEGLGFKDKLLEREMTSSETKKKEKIVLSMKDNADSFKKKYGSRWKEVMYATATKKAMGESLKLEDFDILDETSVVTHNPSADSDTATDMLSGRVQGVAKANDFKSWKVKIEGDGIKRPQEGDKAEDTTARKSVEAHGAAVDQPPIKIGEDIESIDEGKMDHMSLSHLWHRHARHTYGADQGWGGGQGGHHSHHAATAIENHVRKHYGNKVADDMVAHSDHHVAHAEYAGGEESKKIEASAAKLRNKHGIQGDIYGHHEKPMKEEFASIDEGKDPAMDPSAGGQDQFIQNANPSSNPVAKHTPLSRVKELASKSLSKMKSEMLGKATGNM